MRSNLRWTRTLCVGKTAGSPPNRWNSGSTTDPIKRRRLRRLNCAARVNSTPPAPAPTTPIRGASVKGKHAFDEPRPAGQEVVDRLDGHDVFGRSRNVEARRGARIDREDVIREIRPAAKPKHPPVEVDAGDFIVDEAGSRETRERHEIDVGIVVVVVPGDEPRQHAGIRRMNVPADQRKPHSRNRLHAEALDDRDMAVAAADQDKVLRYRRIGSTVHGKPILARRFKLKRSTIRTTPRHSATPRLSEGVQRAAEPG